MDKLIKEVLTNKSERDTEKLNDFIVSEVIPQDPWWG